MNATTRRSQPRPGSRAESDAEYFKANIASIAGATSNSRFFDAALSAADFCAMDIPKPPSLLGDGVLTGGGWAVLYGQPGGGKTWLALELAVALARGEPWLGIPTPPEGVRVGLVQLELGDYAMQARLRALGVRAHPRDGNLSVPPRSKLGAVDLCRREDMAALRAWVETGKLGVLIVDALSRAHTANENSAEELGSLFAELDALRHETSCAVALVHHERKSSGNDTGRDNDLDALRGTSRLQSDPTLLMRLKNHSGGLRSLTFVKVSEGPTPSPVWFRLGGGGRPEVVASPEAKGDKVRELVLQAVLNAAAPVTKNEVAANVGCNPTTAWRHLTALLEAGAVASFMEGKADKYHSATVAPLQPLQKTRRNDGPVLIPNKMGDSGTPIVADKVVVTEGHRCTVATVAPKGAIGVATVADGAPPHGLAPEPEMNAGIKYTSCPKCGGEAPTYGEHKVRICRECHWREGTSEVSRA